MAVTAYGNGYKMTAQGDVLNAATVGYGGTAPFKVRVNAIVFVADATGGTITLNINGTSGPVLYSGTLSASAVSQINYGVPQDFDDLAISSNTGNHITVMVLIK